MSYTDFNVSGIFPYLDNDKTIRAALADREEIRFAPQPNGTTVCCYMISSSETFRDAMSREARGLVFDANGQVISRPLHKFFNVNQLPHTQASVIDWSCVERIMDKRDGSMIHAVAIPSKLGSFSLKSKKSYTSDVALQAAEFMQKSDRGYIEFCEYMIKNGKTPIFEWTSPTARIVLAYSNDDMTLLHIRDNLTGEYVSRNDLQSHCNFYNIPLVDHRDDLLALIQQDPDNAIEKLINETENVEGWVMQFKNGDMVKLKTKWYMDRHHAMTFLRTRDIAKMVIDETLDDLIAKLVGDGINVDQIRSIELKVVNEINALDHEISMFYNDVKHLDRKTLAITHRDYKYFGMVMQKYSGREPDIKAFFAKNFLDDMFDLTQLTLVDSIAEAD